MQLAEGNFRGVETRTKLLAAHCLYIGLVAKFDEQFTLAVEWLKEAKRLDEVEGPGAIAIVQAQLAELRTEVITSAFLCFHDWTHQILTEWRSHKRDSGSGWFYKNGFIFMSCSTKTYQGYHYLTWKAHYKVTSMLFSPFWIPNSLRRYKD